MSARLHEFGRVVNVELASLLPLCAPVLHLMPGFRVQGFRKGIWEAWRPGQESFKWFFAGANSCPCLKIHIEASWALSLPCPKFHKQHLAAGA